MRPMAVKTNHRKEKMLSLRKELPAVEEDRLHGKSGCTLDELDAYLDKIITEA